MDDTLAQKLAAYKPDESVKNLIRETPILLLVGPTGAGKDAIKEKLLATGEYHHIVSHTTRKPRVNRGVAEQDGQDYHFIDKDGAAKMLDDHGFVEAKIYSGNLYGTSVSEIKAAHDDKKIAMTDIEVQGVAEYKALDKNVMAIFVLPPDFQTWQDRLSRRYGDAANPEDTRIRMQTALKELDQLLNTDNYIAVVNRDLDTVFQQIQTIAKSYNHSKPDETKARAIAQQLAKDIQAYLS